MGEYCGFYYVFFGVFLLQCGVGFDQIVVDLLMECFDGVEEVIFVINLNVEGEVMVFYFLWFLMFCGVIVICFVFGFFVGGDIEFVDEVMFVCLFFG